MTIMSARSADTTVKDKLKASGTCKFCCVPEAFVCMRSHRQRANIFCMSASLMVDMIVKPSGV